ncbi:protein-glutamine glutaminase family protein [Chryseobacterium potabilaquae]|uniref:Protein glutaminase domain-containing protein n=1 Tax=Chryseobacterium potabilaquae TaxID=2675057 RepID=A0A6N4XAQ8_9FLAO|nr:protein-glutamine glutaminase family protein [Chryseobacterium potabilaquae]CAA7196675.1 hypothetical protein CHRY9293_02751 [Chryseobacterium potabilaquae]
MKKTLFTTLIWGITMTLISCNQDRDMNETNNINTEREPTLSYETHNKEKNNMIPISINKVGNNYHVLFDLNTSLYIIPDNKQNEEYIKKISEAIGEKRLLITSNNNSIINVQEVLSAERYFEPICREVEYSHLRDVENESVLYQLVTALSISSVTNYPSIPLWSIQNQKLLSSGLPNFKYRVDGCYARAHRMRQILIYKGYKCEKIWLFGNLRAITEENKVINWGWHVTIAVKLRNGKKLVIDPAFQNKPMTIGEWEGKCLDNRGLKGTSKPYKLSNAFTTESRNYKLLNFRNRISSVSFSPEYDNCYTKTTSTLNRYYNLKD